MTNKILILVIVFFVANSLLCTHQISNLQSNYIIIKGNKLELKTEVIFSGAPALVIREFLTKEDKLEEKLKLLEPSLKSIVFDTDLNIKLTNETSFCDLNMSNFVQNSVDSVKDYPLRITHREVYEFKRVLNKKFKAEISCKLFRYMKLPLVNNIQMSNVTIQIDDENDEITSSKGKKIVRNGNTEFFNIIFDKKQSVLDYKFSFTKEQIKPKKNPLYVR